MRARSPSGSANDGQFLASLDRETNVFEGILITPGASFANMCAVSIERKGERNHDRGPGRAKYELGEPSYPYEADTF